MGKTGRTASLTAIIIVASTDRAHANAPCTISAMMCFTPMSSMLSGKYQSEQAELDEKIEQLQSAIATESQNAADAEKWIALMKECVNPTELTAELLNTLIEKIVVHEAVKGEDGSREQEVEIFYRFIGKID